jgi:hypothetical protein
MCHEVSPHTDNVRIWRQIATHCASNARKTEKVLGPYLHKSRQRVLTIHAKIFRVEVMRALRATSMHSLYDGENIYSWREIAIFMNRLKIARLFMRGAHNILR